MQQYLKLLKEIKEKGTWKDAAREGMPRTLSLFGYQNRYDLKQGFPLLTTKKLSFKNIVVELLWFLRGDTNIKYLVDNGVNIWNEDAYNYYLKIAKRDKWFGSTYAFEPFIDAIRSGVDPVNDTDWRNSNYTLGDCGKQYGWLWRHWQGEKDYLLGFYTDEAEIVYKEIDQVKELIDGLKNSPMSRRHIINAWNPSTLDQMALHPCHVLSQFNCRPIQYDAYQIWKDTRFEVDLKPSEVADYVKNNNLPKYYLDCHMYQRSADVFLGVPYNIASYALLTHILCEICGMIPGDFIHSFGDVHIYEDHMDQVNEQLTREPKNLPELVIGVNEADWKDVCENLNFSKLSIDNFAVSNYNPDPAIKAKLSTGLK
jgi:thymidylate synthase